MKRGEEWTEHDPVLDEIIAQQKQQKRDDQEPPRLINGYRIRWSLGEGTFGKVVCATKLGIDVALKQMNFRIPAEDSRQPYKVGLPREQLAEAVQLTCLKHPNILGSLDTFFHKESDGQLYLFIVLPLANCSLRKWLNRFWKLIQPRDLNDNVLLQLQAFAHDIFSALGHLQANEISHNDLKPENFLVFRGGTNGRVSHLRLGDFGSSTLPNASVSNLCGTRLYEAPEIRSDRSSRVVTAGDIWATGIVMLELFFGMDAMDLQESSDSDDSSESGTSEDEDEEEETKQGDGKQKRQHARYIWNGKYSGIGEMILKKRKHFNFRTRYGEACFDSLVDLITRCLAEVPKNRIPPLAALFHPFFSNLPVPASDSVQLDFQFLAPPETTSTTIKLSPANRIKKELLWRLKPCITIDPAIEAATKFIAFKLLRQMRRIPALDTATKSGVTDQELADAEIVICQLLGFHFFGMVPDFVLAYSSSSSSSLVN